ncbi:MAG: LysR family transcriptional regulator [Streptosporangiales bacterium]|nr:LysR family transcriptional regulator [Streptosporangiales bacterium]
MTDFELRQLRSFVAVAEDAGFGRAAQRLHVSQQTLSQHVTKLESALETPLFHRTKGGVELTDAGSVLLSEGKQVLAGAEHAANAVSQAAHGELGTLRIGFVSTAALGIMPRIVLALHRSWPNLHVELKESTTGPQLDAVKSGGLDIGIVREVSTARGLVVRPILKERLVVAVHKSHQFAKRKTIRLRELGDEQFVVFPRRQVSRLYDHIASLCHQAGFHLEPTQEAIEFPTLLSLVAANLGITIVPDSLRALRLPDLRYLTIDDKEALSTISVVCRPDREAAPAVTKFLDTATNVALG